MHFFLDLSRLVNILVCFALLYLYYPIDTIQFLSFMTHRFNPRKIFISISLLILR